MSTTLSVGWCRVVLFIPIVMIVTACGGATRPSAPPVAAPDSRDQTEIVCETGREHLAQGEYVAAAEWLDRCIDLDPTRAYAYYYAGLAYSELNRADRMVNRFERFVQLAPDAPERPRVESLLASTRR